MTTVTNTDIVESECTITPVNLHRVASQKDPKPRPLLSPSSDTISITQYHGDLILALGRRQTYSLLLPTNKSFFLASCGYSSDTDTLYLCSNFLARSDPAEKPTILISKVVFARERANAISSLQWNKLRVPAGMAMPMSGIQHGSGTLYSTQALFGSPEPSGLYHMPLGQPPSAVLTSYYGTPFDAPRGVTVHEKDGSVWFADVGFPGAPRVYRFDPSTGEVRVMVGSAGGLVRPWGVALDGETLYVLDCGKEDEEGKQNCPGMVYAFDITERGGAPFLVNQRVFACPPGGNPKGIACNSQGAVFVCCRDGVEVFGKGGSLLGVIEVPGGASSVTFGGQNELFICSEQQLWRVQPWAD
ncbi:Gluconolactonase [Podospora conica]|nr:Gluconolactonase [Schizothecium conicum]